MKIRFDTRPGVDTKDWECLLAVSCTPDNETPDELLAGGWLFDSVRQDWYMSRSVRIDLARWHIGKSALDSMKGYEWETAHEISQQDIDTLREYRQERGIIEYPYDVFEKLGRVEIEKERAGLSGCWYMTVHFKSTSLYPICAFKKSGTKTSPGKACWSRACQVSKARGSTHLYVYEGYGRGAAYKAGYQGFEWWNGKAWSDDIDEYRACLKRDGG